jgi:hypothetical protein
MVELVGRQDAAQKQRNVDDFTAGRRGPLHLLVGTGDRNPKRQRGMHSPHWRFEFV